MSEVTAPLVCYPNSELVFGVVAPVGTNRDHFLDSFQSLLRGYSFESRIVRLSELIKTIKFPKEGPQVDETTPAIRLDTLMKAGSYIRKETHADDILALMAVCDIFSSRLTGSKKHQQEAAGGLISFGPLSTLMKYPFFNKFTVPDFSLLASILPKKNGSAT